MVSGVALEKALDAQVGCRHHWIIDNAHGPTSWGTCKRCAARREFRNSCPGVEWEERTVSESFRGLPGYTLGWERLRPRGLALEAALDREGEVAC
jgi:hypothetical protein